MALVNSKLRGFGVVAGISAIGLATLSSLVALGPRDASMHTALIFFGVPWLLRLVLVAAAWMLVRPKSRKWRALYLIVAVHSMIQASQSFRWRDAPAGGAGSFDITLWNVGRNLRKMPKEWPRLARRETKLVVLIEAGSFSPDTWKHFIETHPGLTWQRLGGGIVVGVKGVWIDSKPLGDKSRFRCHRVRVEIDGREYSVLVVDIPSQPWLPREPFLNRILDVSSKERCLILGDFNTPPDARGFDAWRGRVALANDAKSKGFRETWCYGLPVLALDQLWVSSDLEAFSASQTVTLRSDHVRMNFRVRPK